MEDSRSALPSAGELAVLVFRLVASCVHPLLSGLCVSRVFSVQPFLSAETRAKIYFLPQDVKCARAFLLQFFEWKNLPAWVTQRLTLPAEQEGPAPAVADGGAASS